jgi:hypothetical protein
MKKSFTSAKKRIDEFRKENFGAEMDKSFSDVLDFLNKAEKKPSQQCLNRILSFASAYSVIKQKDSNFPVIDMVQN